MEIGWVLGGVEGIGEVEIEEEEEGVEDDDNEDNLGIGTAWLEENA